MSYQALLLVSFGGPEGPDDVMPFLENVLRGRNVPRERMLEVAEHYQHFGGKSPLNDQNRELIAALEAEFERVGPRLPVYFGNRNWEPYLADALRQMKADGVKQALALFTSPYSSYSSCRQYWENLEEAAAQVGEGCPEVHKLRAFFNHPGFVEAQADLARQALDAVGAEADILFTAHSIPVEMARTSPYVEQLEETARLVGERLGREGRLVYQSRSGPPSQPWLEPDVLDVIRETRPKAVVLVPIGFLSDHMEVLFDLDTEARELCEELGIPFARAGTVGSHPRFVQGLRELVEERVRPGTARQALGRLGPAADTCEPGCCPPAARPTARAHG